MLSKTTVIGAALAVPVATFAFATAANFICNKNQSLFDRTTNLDWKKNLKQSAMVGIMTAPFHAVGTALQLGLCAALYKFNVDSTMTVALDAIMTTPQGLVLSQIINPPILALSFLYARNKIQDRFNPPTP